MESPMNLIVDRSAEDGVLLRINLSKVNLMVSLNPQFMRTYFDLTQGNSKCAYSMAKRVMGTNNGPSLNNMKCSA